MNVEDIMTKKVISVAKNRALSDAINMMEKKRISRVLVTSDGKPCGMLTEKDIAEHIGSARHGESSPSSLHISTAMNPEFISVQSGTTTEKAARKMQCFSWVVGNHTVFKKNFNSGLGVRQ